MKHRYLEAVIREDLSKKMVFIGGPRQVGKTTLAQRIAGNYKKPAYFNWDKRGHKKAILEEKWSPDTDLLILDEIHKYPKWKSFIKGVWDVRSPSLHIIVTGSARLDIYRRGGDSLMGRYHYFRLHPFSLNEASQKEQLPSFSKTPPPLNFSNKDLSIKALWECGGFPEPFLSGKARDVARWQKDRLERLFREDIRGTENIRDMASLELLSELLPGRVGSPLSVNSLVEDCEVSHKTLSSWLNLLVRNYYVYQISPYSKRLERALKKESKYYVWDWSEVYDEGARFENMVASHLLKFCHFWEDSHGMMVKLWYLRDREKREVDFLVTWNMKPWFLVETSVKPRSEKERALNYFAEKLKIKQKYLVTKESAEDYLNKKTGVRIIPAVKFLSALI